MHYYQFHIGDYKSHTHHLSIIEDLAFRRLLDHYYLHELPIKQRDIARQIGMKDYEQDVLTVLEEFFQSTENGYINPRADREIEQFRAFVEAGKRGAAKRWAKPADSPLIQEAISPPNATPIATINHKPLTIDIPMSSAKLPTCPTSLVIQSYHENLPALPTVRLESESRTKAIGAFWKWVLTSKRTDGTPRAENEEQALQWIGEYFNRANDNDFLMGRNAQSGKHANWKADFDFLLTEKGKRHVIEKTGG
jgi:uncharacterized protein YdaU (DUF1376 family)